MRLLLLSDLHLDTPFRWATPEAARERRRMLRETLRRIARLAGELGVDRLARHGTYEEQIGTWGQRRTGLALARQDAAKRLRSALIGAGEPVGEDLAKAFAEHGERCRERARVGQEAGRRPGLEGQLRERKRSEEMAAKAAWARQAADAQILEAARACGLPAGSPDEAETALHAWEQQHQGELHDLETRQKDWAELEALLGGRTMEELAGALSATEKDVQARVARFDLGEIAVLAGVSGISSWPRAAQFRQCSLCMSP